MPRHIESAIQKNCVTWFRLQYPSIGRLLFAVPNGGARNAREAAIMKGEGVTAGVSDLILLYGSGNYNALCIEFKTQDKSSKQSPLQKEWQALTEQYGNKYVICRSFDDFQQEVQKYLFTDIVKLGTKKEPASVGRLNTSSPEAADITKRIAEADKAIAKIRALCLKPEVEEVKERIKNLLYEIIEEAQNKKERL